MILYKNNYPIGKKERSKREMKISIDELPKIEMPQEMGDEEKDLFMSKYKESE